jgi:hypothetical protein
MRLRRRWEVNIKMDRREIGLEKNVDCIQVQHRVHWHTLVDTVMNLWALLRR